MSAAPPAKKGIGWPVCTLLLVLGLGALGWWSYAKWQEEKAVRQVPAPTVQQPVPRLAAPQTAVPPAPAPGDAYRGLPTYFLAGFAAVMAFILGAILCLWWSLKDLEGGKRHGEGNEKP